MSKTSLHRWADRSRVKVIVVSLTVISGKNIYPERMEAFPLQANKSGSTSFEKRKHNICAPPISSLASVIPRWLRATGLSILSKQPESALSFPKVVRSLRSRPKPSACNIFTRKYDARFKGKFRSPGN